MTERISKMDILAINGSPKMGEGNTALILNPFLEGMRDAGAVVELFYTKKLKVKPCQGDYNCWLKTPGKCIHKDDMEMLLPKLAGADIWVFATPVYFDGISGALKNLIDRMLPLVEPFYELRDGHCRHPRRAGTKSGKLVLVSNCGFWEMDNFDPLLVHIKAICKNVDREFAGALLRPHGTGMRRLLQGGGSMDDVFAAAKEAGRQLVADGKMSPATLQAVSRDLLSLEQQKQSANQFFQQMLNNVK
jgi:multimeric flavodoxin WrbA